ncbi:MAG: hypothetical protein HY721_23200 [Planctomycetes bacterium]|nr:hypothetical protein [Planctomycetota bacterium]
MARLGSREHAGAQRDFAVACHLAPGHKPSLLLAKAHYLEDDKAAAEDVFREMHRSAAPEDKTEAALWIAAVYNALRDWQKGLEWTEELGDRPLADRLRGFFYCRLGRMEDALVAGRRAIARDGGDLLAHRILAAALLEDVRSGPGPRRAGRLPELLRVSSAALELDPDGAAAQGIVALAAAEVNQALVRFLRRKTMTTQGMTRALWARALAVLAGATAGAQEGFFDEVERIDVGMGGGNCCISVSAGERALYFGHYEGSPRNNPDIYVMTRTSRDDPFGPARPIPDLNTPFEDWVGPGSLSVDGREIYLVTNRPGGSGGMDIWVARFNVPGDPQGGFHDIEPLGEDLFPGVNTTGRESRPHISRDGDRLYFERDPGSQHHVAARDGASGGPVLLNGQIGRPFAWASISADEKTVFWGQFGDQFRPGGYGSGDIWMATRESVLDDFGRPAPFDPATVVNPGPRVNTASYENMQTLTADWPASGSGLYFLREGTNYRATWHPDCNGNHLDDGDEIESGEARDTDQNGVPDECEALPPAPAFRRGAARGETAVDISDGIRSLNSLFLGAEAPPCPDAADADDSGALDLTDAVRIFGYLFLGAPPPPEPGPLACGPDPSEDALDCASFPACP